MPTHAPLRRGLLALAATLTLGAAGAPAAHADSIVYIKDHNVWVAEPDGSVQHQVTRDGTAEWPYRSPSQADDGTIVASHVDEIVRMRQNGLVLNRIDPPALMNSVSQPVDGPPVSLAISPDGTKVAYAFASYTCPIAADCLARTASSVTWADRFTPRGTFAEVTYGNPTWVGNARLLVTGGYLSHINLVDIAPGSQRAHWFDDQDYFGENSSDMGEGAVSRDGTRVAAVHGYDGDWEGSIRRIIWFNTTADPRAGSVQQPKPQDVCVTGALRGMHSPTWSPDSRSIAFEVPDGIEVDVAPTRGEDCGQFNSRLTIPGGKEPDWGPAPVAPEPLPQPPGDKPGPGGPGKPGGNPGSKPGGTTDTGVTWRLQGSAKLGAVLRSGAKLRLTGLPARKQLVLSLQVGKRRAKQLRLSSRTIAKGSARASRAGTATVRLRVPKATANKLRKVRSLELTLKGGGLGSPSMTLRR